MTSQSIIILFSIVFSVLALLGVISVYENVCKAVKAIVSSIQKNDNEISKLKKRLSKVEGGVPIE